ncbi:MAG: UDP-N-acetylmuramoyl-tripeptide--D-alanyl-D-alanine ligase [Candidatus Melainabacteria bacterium]|nr:UDP-N-acetylmuramoyl-tripeptide--D-alanyl-D-alanine ligase [Candidatus Melainabacteria bacterium]
MWLLELNQYQLINTDSRNLELGQIFLALKGANFDGHDFIEQALDAGAQLVYSEQEHQDSRVKQVDNCLKQYHRLANEYRNLIDPIVIGITGSAGKTTAKELLAAILSEKYKVHYTQANFNNEIGVPKTILSMPVDTEVLILEMGMRGLGEIDLLSKTAEPNIALITNIGTAHIERLGSRENIKKAKLEILSGLKDHALVVADQKLTQELEGQFKLISFEAQSQNEPAEPKYLISEGLLASIDACSKIAQQLTLSEQEITAGLKKFSPGRGRGDFVQIDENIFIDETYNSNPEALRNSVKALIERFPDDHKYALVGDINESEAELIEQVFAEIKKLENDKFKLLDARGLEAKAAQELLRAQLSSDKNIILVKASRSAKFEEVLTSLCSSG